MLTYNEKVEANKVILTLAITCTSDFATEQKQISTEENRLVGGSSQRNV